MSETLSQDPETLGSGYNLATNYPPTPATPSSTVQDPPGSNLPPFSTFAADMDTTSGFSSDRFLSDTRLLDISNWDYYTETRLLERQENGLSIISSQPQYRPWESKPVDSTSQHGFATTTPVTTFADAFIQNGVSKLPSFQSQFQSYNEAVTTTEPTLTTLTNLTPLSPNSSSPSLTTLNTNFHTLSAVNPRNYPLVPAPIQAREIPSIQQQFLDERHIQLYTHPTNIATLNTAGGIFQSQNGTLIQNSQLLGSPTVVTVIKSEPDMKLTTLCHQDTGLKIQNLHPTQFQNPMPTILDSNGLYNGLDKKLNGINATANSPTRNDFRKKERRKMRASSLESSAESDGASSNMDLGSESSGQVAAVSSTASFKTHHGMMGPGANSLDVDVDISGVHEGKQVKKKRKRCGECVGCQRKDNCGDCAPCRNDKSHQICKQRRCEKLTEKKNLYGDPNFMRGESRRGRGKGRGAGSYRGRKPNASVSLPNSSVPEASVPSSRPSPQPVHMLKPEQAVQQQPMAPMPFYADPGRFSTPVWQTEPAQTWPQGQFIQQIAAPSQGTPLEAYPQQYPNGIYQTTYQQPAFETNTFYTGAVQVLTNARPPSEPPRANGSYSHTPSPVPAQQPTTPRSNISGQYHQEYVNNQGYAAPPTPTGDNQSRPSSVNSVVNAPANNQNFQNQSNGFTAVSSTNFSPGSNSTPSYVNANSGNEKPGYPQVNSNPQLASHNSSGYPGNQYSGNIQEQQQQQQQQHLQQQQQQQQQHQQQHQQQQAHWQQINSENMMWEPHIAQQAEQPKDSVSNMPHHPEQIQQHDDNLCGGDQYSQTNRIELNSRLKTMILNKHQSADRKMEETNQAENENKTGHFLWYSHHRRPPELTGGGGGVPHPSTTPGTPLSTTPLSSTPLSSTPLSSIPLSSTPLLSTPLSSTPLLVQPNHNLPKENAQFMRYPENGIKQEFLHGNAVDGPMKVNSTLAGFGQSHLIDRIDVNGKTIKLENQGMLLEDEKIKALSTDIPACNCFPPDKLPPEPGNYYTHLGCSNSLTNLRKDFEERTGVTGKAIRIEKVRYTGKEGKTPQGCPLAKWIIRRSNSDEKYLVVVKHRQGHVCPSAYIVVCIVAWEGILQPDADSLYSTLTEKLNKFGLPTTRRCATNEQRSCACQGLDAKTCGASFSFGCSWSMYYNGCKFARSKIVRKFRLTEKSEEENMETRLQNLTTSLSPLYKVLAPESFKNQCVHECEAEECRLGLKDGRPFSGVTACMDFCAHAHKDSHNMNNGCTAVVTLTKDRSFKKHEDEQLHVLPLYTVDGTDEYGSKEQQEAKYKDGSIEVLNKYECEVRLRTVPLQPCRRRKKKTETDNDNQQHNTPAKKDNISSRSSTSSGYESSRSQTPQTPIKMQDNKVLQSNHVSSTKLESPPAWLPNGFHQPYEENPWFHHHPNIFSGSRFTPKNFIPNNPNTAFTYPSIKQEPSLMNRFDYTSQSAQSNYTQNTQLMQNKVQDSHSGISNSNNNHSLINSSIGTPGNNIIDYSTGIVNSREGWYNSLSSTPLRGPPYPYKVPEMAPSPIHHIPNYNYCPPSLIENNISLEHRKSLEPQQSYDHKTISVSNSPFYNLTYPRPNLPHYRTPSDIWYDQQISISKNFYYKPPYAYSYPHPNPHFLNNNQNINPNTYHLCNPFDDIGDYGKSRLTPFPVPPQSYFVDSNWPPVTTPISEPIESLGKVIDVIDNAESFLDSQIGGVAIALTHGSVLFECAKHELHATTALKKPNRLSPTRISLVYYQHRNLNKPKHGWDQWEEKTRLKKLGLSESNNQKLSFDLDDSKGLERDGELLIRAPTMSLTTLFPMYPCIVSGPYQETQSF